jgi:DNA-binding SARP family transcriptional activator
MTPEAIFMLIAAPTIALYVGLATHVVSRNPNQAISWVFGGFCLTIAVSSYLLNLFLFAGLTLPAATLPILRFKWMLGSFIPVLYLHLVSFFFPLSWQQVRRWGLRLAYVSSAGLAIAALVSDWLIAGVMDRSAQLFVEPLPGPLMILFSGLSGVIGLTGVIGLAAGYRAAPQPFLRRQFLYVLIPSGLTLSSGLLTWLTLLIRPGLSIPREWADLLLLAAGLLYAHAVLRHSLFMNGPTAWRDLFYALSSAVAGLLLVYLTFSLDYRLERYTSFPYPLITGLLVVVIAAGFLPASHWLATRLDQAFFPAEHWQRGVAAELVEILAAIPDRQQRQAELLAALYVALDTLGGYVAVIEPGLPAEQLTVTSVEGRLPLQPGDRVQRPRWFDPGGQPQVINPLLLAGAAGWAGIALFCPLLGEAGVEGVIALAEKRRGAPFTPAEFHLCGELSRQMSLLERLAQVRRQQAEYQAAAHQQQQALHQVTGQATTSTHRPAGVTSPGDEPAGAALVIRLLGPLQAICHGWPVTEADWGSERAKILLGYLLWKGQAGASREEISQALWPGRPAAETANVFHVTLHRLRRALGPAGDTGYILHERGRYRFDQLARCWVDVTAFQSLAATGEAAALAAAVALYGGTFLEDVAFALPPEVAVEQQRLEQLYLDTLRRLAVPSAGAEALVYLEKLVAVEPADDPAQRALVLGYLARGRRDLARRQIARWRRALADLEVEPSPEARQVWNLVEKKVEG